MICSDFETEQIITSDMPMSEILTRWPETIPVFMEYKMTCIGCYMSPFDTLEDALTVHGVPAGNILKALNQIVRDAKNYHTE